MHIRDSKRKCVLLIIDGLGDLPVAELGGRTPLEAASTPVLDQLASEGRYGLVDPVAPGVIPNTHSGCGMLFGVFPGETGHLKRGPVEASGAGRLLSPGEIAFRANFATFEEVDHGFCIRDRRAGRISSGTAELASSVGEVDLGDGVFASLQPTDQHRCVLVLSGPGLNPEVSDTDPGDGKEPLELLDCRPLAPGAEATANKVNAFIAHAHRVLRSHPINIGRQQAGKLPANGVLTRGAGAAFTLDNVLSSRGIKAAVVVGCNTVRGMARILGFEAVSEAGFTADAGTDLEAKMAAALRALEKNDLAYLHIKAPDLFSHDRQPLAKRDFVERLDKAIASLREAGVMIALTADHTTDSNTGAHTADPVPTLLYQPGSADRQATDPVNFGEQACREGNLPRQRSHDFLLDVVSRMGF